MSIKIFSKINVLRIIKNHLGTLVNFRTKKPGFGDVITFFCLPILIASILVYLGIKIDESKLTILIATLSILGGFSFNLLAIVFGYMDKIKRNLKGSENEEVKRVYLTQIHDNISFSIINALCCIVFSFFTQVNFEHIKTIEGGLNYFNMGAHFFTYFLVVFYFLTLLMILKRLSILFKKDVG